MPQDDPQYLYRYRHLQGDHRRYTSQILTDSVLYFPPPTEFNDPFDCRVHFQPSVKLPELRKMFSKILRKEIPHLNREQRRRLIIENYRGIGRNPTLENITIGIQNDLNRLGVLSLSTSDRNILLWSHYAASHSGLCLQFLADKNTPFFGRAQPIQYSNEYPQVCLHDDPDWHIISFLLTKAHDWIYEEEWRIIDTTGYGERVFPENLLVGVILGARMSPEDREYIINLLRGRKSPVKIYQASVIKGSFSLNINEYEP